MSAVAIATSSRAAGPSCRPPERRPNKLIPFLVYPPLTCAKRHKTSVKHTTLLSRIPTCSAVHTRAPDGGAAYAGVRAPRSPIVGMLAEYCERPTPAGSGSDARPEQREALALLSTAALTSSSTP